MGPAANPPPLSLVPQMNAMSWTAPHVVVPAANQPPMRLLPQMDAKRQTAPHVVIPAASQPAWGPALGSSYDLAGQGNLPPDQLAHASLQQHQVGRDSTHTASTWLHRAVSGSQRALHPFMNG